MAGEIESPRIEQPNSPEPEGFVEGQAGLQARLMAAVVSGDRELLNPNKKDIPPITPDAVEITKEDLSIIGEASTYERRHYWETTRTTVDQQRRYEIWAQETKAAFNTTEFFATEKGQQWSAFFKKLDIHTGSFTDADAKTLYDKYFSPTSGRDTVDQFIQDIYNVSTTQEEFRQNRDAIQWVSRLFGDKSAQVMAQIADAGTKKPQEIADAANADDRRNDLNDTEYDLLDFLYDPEVSLNRTRPAHLNRPVAQPLVSSVVEHAALAPVEPTDVIEEHAVEAPVAETAVTVNAAVLPATAETIDVQQSTWAEVGSTFPFLTESGWNGLSEGDRQGLASLDAELSGALTLRTEEGKEAEYTAAVQAIKSRYESLSPKLHNQVSAVLREVGIDDIAPVATEAPADKQADAKEQVVVIGEEEKPQEPWKNLGITEETWNGLSEREQQNLVFLENKLKAALSLRVGREKIKNISAVLAKDRRGSYRNAVQSIERSYQVLPLQVKDQVLEALRKQLNLDSLSATEQAVLAKAAVESGEELDPFVTKLRAETIAIFPELERRPEEAVAAAISTGEQPVREKTWEEMMRDLAIQPSLVAGISESEHEQFLPLLKVLGEAEQLGVNATNPQRTGEYVKKLQELQAVYSSLSEAERNMIVPILKEKLSAEVLSDEHRNRIQRLAVDGVIKTAQTRYEHMQRLAQRLIPDVKREASQKPEAPIVADEVASSVPGVGASDETEADMAQPKTSVPAEQAPEIIEGDVVEAEMPIVETISNEKNEHFQKTVAEIKKYGDAIMPPSIEPINDDAIPHLVALLQMIPNVHITEEMLLAYSARIRQTTDAELTIPDLLDKKLNVNILYPHNGDPMEIIFERTLPKPKQNKEELFITIRFTDAGEIDGGRIAFGERGNGYEGATDILAFDTDGTVIGRNDDQMMDVTHIDYAAVLDEITRSDRKNDRIDFRELITA